MLTQANVMHTAVAFNNVNILPFMYQTCKQALTNMPARFKAQEGLSVLG